MGIETLYGQEVRIYWNFHKKVYSVQVKTKGRWKVATHLSYFALWNPTYKVYQSGRARVLREKRKNVHAFIYGRLLEFGESKVREAIVDCVSEDRVTYNPHAYDTFIADPYFKKRPMDGTYYGVLRCQTRDDSPSMWHYGT